VVLLAESAVLQALCFESYGSHPASSISKPCPEASLPAMARVSGAKELPSRQRGKVNDRL
jgi:hypothetical protein